MEVSELSKFQKKLLYKYYTHVQKLPFSDEEFESFDDFCERVIHLPIWDRIKIAESQYLKAMGNIKHLSWEDIQKAIKKDHE